MRKLPLGMVWMAVLLVILFAPVVASAQVVINPRQAVFAHTDADFAITAAYHLDFYQCASVSLAGVCTGQAAQPLQLGIDVTKASVTGTAAARVIDLTTTPTNTLLSSVPIGVGIVATIAAVGDPNVPGVLGQSAPSVASNGFFARGRTPAAPGRPTLVQ